MKITHGQDSRFAWLALVCVGLLLVLSTVPAVHSCGLRNPGGGGPLHRRSASSPDAFCLTCLMVQFTAVLFLVLIVFPGVLSSLRICFSQAQPRPLLAGFRLYVRPPPVY